MVRLDSRRREVMNGVFEVSKDEGKQRLFIGARHANMVFQKPPKVDLPNRGLIADLLVESQHPLYPAKSDMENYCHRLAMLEWVSTYIGLRPKKINGRCFWLVVRIIQMGWSQ